jgi:hypothetical protein
MHTVMLVLIAPLTNLILFGTAAWGATALAKRIPNGRFKRILFKKW